MVRNGRAGTSQGCFDVVYLRALREFWFERATGAKARWGGRRGRLPRHARARALPIPNLTRIPDWHGLNGLNLFMADAHGAVASTTTMAVTETPAPVIPGREEILKQFASEILGSEPPPEAKAGEAQTELSGDAGKNAKVLSQAETKQAEAAPAQAGAAEPKWTEAQTKWFADMDAAKTDEERAQIVQPEFSETEIAWLAAQEAAAEPAKAGEPDHLAEDAELKGKLDASTQERINKRIGKEVAKTKEAKEAAEQAQAKIAELEQQLATRAPSPDVATGKLAKVFTPAELQAEADKATQAREQSEDLLTMLEDDPEGVEAALKAAQITLAEYTPAQMRKFLTGIKRNAEHTLNRDLPQRAQFLKAVDASAGEAMQLLPELKNAKSEQRQVFDAILKAPSVMQFAGWPKALALMVLGLEAERQRAAAKAAPAPKPKRPLPVVIPAARGAAPTVRQTTAGANLDAAGRQALDGDKKARLQYIQSLIPKS